MAYRYLTVKRNGKTVLLHRWMMEQHLGRALRQDEHVHHRNGDRRDNRIENFELKRGQQHIEDHAEERRIHPRTKRCEVCGVEYTPHRTKRKRSRTCGKGCANELRSRTERATKSPPLAAAIVSANVRTFERVEVAA